VFFRFLIIFLLLFCIGLGGCGPVTSHYVAVEQDLKSHRYDEADVIIEKNKAGYGETNAVLFYLDQGMTRHLAGRYEESNKSLSKAEALIDELYTKSISNAAASIITNDNVIPYEGEDFEKVMVNVFMALNYLNLGLWDDALVEARKVDHKLDVLHGSYETAPVYNDDAFARYLSGMLYESMGELNDALISYRMAYKVYLKYQQDYGVKPPLVLVQDLLRLTEHLHFPEEFQEYRSKYPAVTWMKQSELDNKAVITVISQTGFAPYKKDYFFDAPIPDGSGGTYYLRIAFPEFVERPTKITHVDVSVQELKLYQSADCVEDITAIAVKDLKDRIGRISAKAIARATAKYLASATVQKQANKQGGLAGFLAKVATTVYSVGTEQADKRSWRTLPSRIYLTKFVVDPGNYNILVDFYPEAGQETFTGISVTAKQFRILNCRNTD